MSETPQQAARRLADGAISKGCKPQALHEYTDRDGTTLHWRIRLKHPTTGEKWIRPMKLNGAGYTLGEPEYPDGKPLYRLHDLATRPDDTVIVVEGEWCADALPKAGALATTSGAADSAEKADWSIMAGRTVTIWPDNDGAGRRYADAVASILLAMGCTVRIIDVDALNLPSKGDAVDWLKANPGATMADIAALPTVEALQAAQTSARSEHQADEENAASPDVVDTATPVHDAALIKNDVTGVTDVQPNNGGLSVVTSDETDGVTGVTPEPIIPDESKRPCFKVFDDWQKLPGGAELKPGVWSFTVKHGKGEEPPALTQQWVCSPVHVEAVTFDGQDNNFGRLLRFKTTVGKWREWAMPMELLRGAGDELRGELLAMGVEIDPHAGRTLLGHYLQAIPPKRRIRCALQVGWCGDSFVLPDAVIGPKASDVIFQSGERGHDEHTKGGTLAGWQANIAARAVGNPMMVLGMSVSFAGPMLKLCNAESGGLHFVGESSIGKSTIADAGCSTWGGPNFRRSWRATANGMEGVAALFSDCLLALDDTSEAEPKEIGTIVYALGNGTGKQRASRTGNARAVTRWRCAVLSNGERTIATTMAEAGHRAKAGQSVRLLDIPAVRGFGVLDNLHGFKDGAAFSDAIKKAAATNHGHAGRAFLEKLTRDKRNFAERLELIKSLPELSAEGGEGQDKRGAARFALVALAGEVATEYGITGWPEGAAIEAAVVGFKAWRSTRGRGNDERRQILEQVAGFISLHGDSRFSSADAYETADAMRINRAGWWRDDGLARVYLFNAEGLREAVKGFDFKRALDILQEVGALPATSGERAKAQRIGGRLVRLYQIIADKLGGDHGA